MPKVTLPGLDLDIGGVLVEEAWTNPALSNGWVAFSVNHHPAGYMKDKEGRVHLRGVIKNGVTAQGTSLFVLPAGYRPALNKIFAAVTNDLFASIQVTFGGTVQIESTTVSATYLSLDGISFMTN